MEDATKITLILNGAAADDDDLRQVVEQLRDDGYEMEVRVSWEGGHTKMFTEEAVDAGVDAVIACGGDGTIHEVVNGVMHREASPIIGGLPYGTGNDFLTSLNIFPRDNPEQLLGWLQTAPTPIDVGHVQLEDRYFVNMATAGVAAEVTSEASQQLKDVAGSFAYFVRAIPAAFDLPTRQARINAEGLDWQGELAFLFVGNGRQSGGGWTLCPAARLDDGFLDVVIVPEMPLREMARHGRQMVRAESTGDFGPLIYRQVAEVEVEFGDDIPLNLDGEPVHGESFRFSIVENALRFLIPPVS